MSAFRHPPVRTTWTGTAVAVALALSVSGAAAARSSEPILQVSISINFMLQEFDVEGVEVSPGVFVYNFTWGDAMAAGQAQVISQTVGSPRLVVALGASSSSPSEDAGIELVLTQNLDGDGGSLLALRGSAGACATFVPATTTHDPIQSFGDAPLIEWSLDGEVVGSSFPAPFSLPPTTSGFQLLTPMEVDLPESLLAAPATSISTTIRVVAGVGANVLVNTSLVADPNVADVNGDGHVNSEDLGLLLSSWTRPGRADLDGSGEVDGVDLGLLLAAWTG
ncbi:MAG: dockerin type I repeat-containing protein [Phycisphaerales bacterium]|nr:dockerin type I repeat-containing protein [Phycisphaerales bacterium]